MEMGGYVSEVTCRSRDSKLQTMNTAKWLNTRDQAQVWFSMADYQWYNHKCTKHNQLNHLIPVPILPC